MPDGVTISGSAVTGTGDARGIDLPTEARGDGADIFERLERQRAAHQVRSPFGPPDQRTVTPPSRAQKAARKSDEQRFVAPAIDVATEPAPELVVAPDAATPVDAPRSMDHGPSPEPVHDARCGQLLTGGGAPRGWVLVRIIGQGQPHRYCSPACAVKALNTPPARTETVQQRTEFAHRADTPRPRAPRRAPVPSTIDQAEVVRRYGAGETPPQIGKALGHTAGTIRRALDRAGVQRRDDRATGSGGANRIDAYPDHLVARVRALYTLHGLTQAKVGEALGITAKVVQTVMAKHGIEARPPAHIAGAQRLYAEAVGSADQRWRETLAALEVEPADVRDWCSANGVTCSVRGPIPMPARDAWLAAHEQAVA